MIKIKIFDSFLLAMCEPSIHESCSDLERFSFFTSECNHMNTRIYIFLDTIVIDSKSSNWLITMVSHPCLSIVRVRFSHCSKILNKYLFSPIFDICTLERITEFICRCIHNFRFPCCLIFLITCQGSFDSCFPERMIFTLLFDFCES